MSPIDDTGTIWNASVRNICFFSPFIYLLNHLFISVWTHYFILWVIIHYYVLYLVAQIVLDLAAGRFLRLPSGSFLGLSHPVHANKPLPGIEG